jgi:hypothetical protein
LNNEHWQFLKKCSLFNVQLSFIIYYHLRNPVPQLANTFLLRTMRATEQDSCLSFHAVADDPASTMVTGRGQRIYRTFETVKGVARSTDRHFKSFVVFVATDFAGAHVFTSNSFKLQKHYRRISPSAQMRADSQSAFNGLK